MDLKAILALNKSKTERTNLNRKPVEIADEDRPYSLIEPDQDLIAKTGNKLATNWQQSSNKTEKKPATNWQQTGNKPATPHSNLQQSGNRTSNTIRNKLATNWQQSSNKVATKTSFSELVGLQRDIIIFICHECKNSRSRTTEALTLEHMAMCLKRNAGAIRTTMQRLEKKGCLLRVGFKNGRGGWTRYELPDSIYHEVLRSETGNKLATNWQQSGNKVASQLATELATTAPSSSSNINTTTTAQSSLSDEWGFDLSPYSHFGFGLTQIKQLVSAGTIKASDAEQSLIEFAYDLENNCLPTIKTNKINFLMGLLRSGNMYVSENYRNEQERMIRMMSERAIKKGKAQLEEKFMAWEHQLTDAQREELVKKMPMHLIVLYKTNGMNQQDIRKWLMDYYLQKCSM